MRPVSQDGAVISQGTRPFRTSEGYHPWSNRRVRCTERVAAMITPTTATEALGVVAVLPGGRCVLGPASVDSAPSA